DKSCRGNTDENGSPWHAQRVLDYLQSRESTGDKDPFFIYMGFSHPHDPRNGQPQLLAKYGATNHADPQSIPAANPAQPALPPNYLPAHPFPHGHPNLRDEVKVSGVWKNRDPTTIRNEIGRQYACSELIDTQIGRVLDKLRSMNQLDNTYVFYVSDHGMAIGRHGLQGKQNLYEHTFRIPMIVAGPGISSGRCTGNVYLLDVLATVCELASIDAPATNEGISFAGCLKGRTDAVRDTLFGVYTGGTKPGMRCVKQGDWKLIQYDTLDGTVRKTQLFHLADNPLELLEQHADEIVIALTGNKPNARQTNLANNPKYRPQLEAMRAVLLRQMRQHDDPFPLWDQPTSVARKALDALVVRDFEALLEVGGAANQGILKDLRDNGKQSPRYNSLFGSDSFRRTALSAWDGQTLEVFFPDHHKALVDFGYRADGMAVVLTLEWEAGAWKFDDLNRIAPERLLKTPRIPPIAK
ncbi:MAG: sulfatase-like hydrolase/transferase, partial [Planctomycetota bacterium]